MYMHGYYELQYTTDHVMSHIHVHIIYRGVPIWQFLVVPILIIFLPKSTDTDH